MGALRTIAALFLLVLAGASCARVPPTRYGVRRLRLEGVESLDDESLRACLATAERPRASINFGATKAGPCGEPPFAARHYRLKLWSWPWAEWPLFDRVMFERDMARIERWYAARGYHAARVVGTEVVPEGAADRDTIPDLGDEGGHEPGCERRGRKQGCTVDLSVQVEEGEPTTVSAVSLSGHEGLPEELAEKLVAAFDLEEGERFDEGLYDRGKAAMRDILASAGHAVAKISGVVRVDRPRREARIELTVVPGPPCELGEVRVEGAEGLPEAPIRAATRLRKGASYRPGALADAERAVYGLGAFSAVVVEPVLPEEGNVVDVLVKVTPARRQRWGIGAGIESGVTNRGDGFEQISVPEWDVHLITRYSHRNLFGGLRQLSVQERARMILQEPFPGFETPRFGNRIGLEFRQPGLIEPRLNLVLAASHDYGPDHYDTFFRHTIDSSLSLQRAFWRHRIFASFGIGNNIYLVPDGETAADGGQPPASSILTFLEQKVRLDLRDNGQRPHSGFFLQASVQEAGYFLPSSWDLVRLLPETRFYIPLPLGITVAGRFALGLLFITEAVSDLDAVSRQLGPREARLRGGGASSNRGFLPGYLGDGSEGGTRRWEASLEVRFRITDNFGVTVFADMGDVSREPRFRFDHIQLSVGGGLRYSTIIGVLRLDLAGRIPGAQVVGGEDLRDPSLPRSYVDFGLFSFPGAVHFSIGEAF